MQDTNCCYRCGQTLSLIEEAWAEDKSIVWTKNKEICPQCYQDLVEKRS
ncbi:MAG: hypothetical protein WAO24_02025 [Peptococcia bacterium]